MPNSERNIALKAGVLNNLKQPREAESIADYFGWKLYSEFDIDNTTGDDDISAFNDAICFIQFVCIPFETFQEEE